MAKLGAKVTITDQKDILPLLHKNVHQNFTNNWKPTVQEFIWGTNVSDFDVPYDYILISDCT